MIDIKYFFLAITISAIIIVWCLLLLRDRSEEYLELQKKGNLLEKSLRDLIDAYEQNPFVQRGRLVLKALDFFDLKDDVSWKTIKEKYRRLVKIYHPDLNKSKNKYAEWETLQNYYTLLKKEYEHMS